MTRLKNQWGFILVIVTVLAIDFSLPLGTAVRFGGDEGFKLMPAFLMSKGFVLYKQIWSDQPPVYPLLLSTAFKIWGPSILPARLIAASFGLLLFIAMYQLVKLRLRTGPALLATFFLMASPATLELSVSVMQEAAVFALAMVSVWFFLKWCTEPHWGWLIASGTTMGVALGTKLSAAIVVPGIIAELINKLRHDGNPQWVQKFALTMLTWLAACILLFMNIMLIWGKGSLHPALRAHFTGHPVYGMDRPQDFPFSIEMPVDHLDGVIAAFVGLVLVIKLRKIRIFSFPVTMLFTVLIIHIIHRPWWMYYYLHLAIPMAWLAGYGIYEVGKFILKRFGAKDFSFFNANSGWIVLLAILTALALVRSERRLEAGIIDLRNRPRISTSPIINKMAFYKQHTHWVYVQFSNEVYPFHAQLPMPPELAIVTLKRFWSDQITEEEIINTCNRYKVEQLLLTHSLSLKWPSLNNEYNLVCKQGDLELYIAKTIKPD